MNNHQIMKLFFNNFSGQGNVLTIPKPYLILTGDINKALVLNQMIYYSGITKRKDGYFYKSYKEWLDEVFLTQYQINKITKEFETLGYVETKLKKASGSPTIHYKINIEVVQNAIMKKLDNRISSNSIMEDEETSQSLTEITTESYTKKEKTIVGKPDIDYSEIVKYLNKMTGRNYKSTTKATQKAIRARVNEGFTIEDFKQVIDKKTYEWLNNEKWQKFLRPETLFGNKFEGYLNQGFVKDEGKKTIAQEQQDNIEKIQRELGHNEQSRSIKDVTADSKRLLEF